MWTWMFHMEGLTPQKIFSLRDKFSTVQTNIRSKENPGIPYIIKVQSIIFRC